MPALKKRVLIVDDNAVNRKYLKTVLKDYDLTEAENGIEALEQFDTTAADLILMDIQMPVMDGMECMKVLRDKNVSIPILAITAFSGNEDRDKFINEGFSDFLAKPLPPNTIRTVVGNWLSPDKQTLQVYTNKKPDYSEFDLDIIEDLKKYLTENEYKKLVADFIDETKIFLNNIDLLTNKDDFSSIIRILHTIKGNAASLGFYRLSKLSAVLEAKLKNEQFQNFSDNFEAFKSNAYASFEAFKTQLNRNDD